MRADIHPHRILKFMPRGQADGGRNWLYLMGLAGDRVKVGVSCRPRERFTFHRGLHRESLLWFHLGPSGGYRWAYEVERLTIAQLSQIGERVGGKEIFVGVSREVALGVMRQLAESTHLRMSDFERHMSARVPVGERIPGCSSPRH